MSASSIPCCATAIGSGSVCGGSPLTAFEKGRTSPLHVPPGHRRFYVWPPFSWRSLAQCTLRLSRLASLCCHSSWPFFSRQLRFAAFPCGIPPWLPAGFSTFADPCSLPTAECLRDSRPFQRPPLHPAAAHSPRQAHGPARTTSYWFPWARRIKLSKTEPHVPDQLSRLLTSCENHLRESQSICPEVHGRHGPGRLHEPTGHVLLLFSLCVPAVALSSRLAAFPAAHPLELATNFGLCRC